MTADHFVRLEGDSGDISATFVCEAPVGSPCRMVPECECEEWHTEDCEAKYPDGPPMRAIDYCNPKEFIDAEGAQWSAAGGYVTVPVTTEWHEGTYIYDFDHEAAS